MQKQLQSPISQIQAWLFSSSLVGSGTNGLMLTLTKLLSLLLLCLHFGQNISASSLYIGEFKSADNVIPAPVKIVESQTNILLDELSHRKIEFDKEPKQLVSFARNVALSHWDLRRTSRIMLGKYWKSASKSQREQFTEEFLRTLLRYVVKAYGFYDESLVEIVSYDWQPRGKGGWVRSVIRLPAGLKVSVDYRMLKDQLQQWKMVDVRVEGISLVNSKKSEYRGMIVEDGLEALIENMHRKNQKVLSEIAS